MTMPSWLRSGALNLFSIARKRLTLSFVVLPGVVSTFVSLD